MNFSIEIEQEEDGRLIAEVMELSGVMTYGATPEDVRAKVQALALRVLVEQLESNEVPNRTPVA
jgi:predicted RNase H-like HicB family nuclease